MRNSSGAAQPNIDVRQLAERVHALINAERNKNRLGPLAFDSKIASIAQNHSVDMALNDYFAHDNLQGLDPTDRGATVGYDCIKRYGTRYTFGLAENIHQGWLYSSTTYFNGVPIRDWNTQDELTVVAVRGWMNSAGHRENILTDTYDRSGVGVAIAEDDKVYITQNFC
ncbi:MAG: CAP domain-containing protein [Chloroflexi bacterium]|nr:CAP domain-containing protein [Chloroflexota bacterium]